MDIGLITGAEIGRNRDGDTDRILLQVQMLDDEVRTVELFLQPGVDDYPANGCRVFVNDASESEQIGIAISDDFEPEVLQGEKELYSTDNPVTTKLARFKLNKDSELILNSGTKSAVNHPDLNTALQTFLTALNGQLTGLGAPGGLTIDLTAAEVPKVKL